MTLKSTSAAGCSACDAAVMRLPTSASRSPETPEATAPAAVTPFFFALLRAINAAPIAMKIPMHTGSEPQIQKTEEKIAPSMPGELPPVGNPLVSEPPVTPYRVPYPPMCEAEVCEDEWVLKCEDEWELECDDPELEE